MFSFSITNSFQLMLLFIVKYTLVLLFIPVLLKENKLAHALSIGNESVLSNAPFLIEHLKQPFPLRVNVGEIMNLFS